MMEMTGRTLRDAADLVDDCAAEAELHTVTLLLDGASGGAILTIQGSVEEHGFLTDFERKYIVGTTRNGELIPST